MTAFSFLGELSFWSPSEWESKGKTSVFRSMRYDSWHKRYNNKKKYSIYREEHTTWTLPVCPCYIRKSPALFQHRLQSKVALLTSVPFALLSSLSAFSMRYYAFCHMLQMPACSLLSFPLFLTQIIWRQNEQKRNQNQGCFCQAWHRHDLYNCFWQKCFAYQISFFIKLPGIQ